MNGEPKDQAEDDDQGAEALVNVVIKTLSGQGGSLSIPVGVGDTIMDVRHFLTESPETCHYTHYQLRHEGVQVNDFTEVPPPQPDDEHHHHHQLHGHTIMIMHNHYHTVHA